MLSPARVWRSGAGTHATAWILLNPSLCLVCPLFSTLYAGLVPERGWLQAGHRDPMGCCVLEGLCCPYRAWPGCCPLLRVFQAMISARWHSPVPAAWVSQRGTVRWQLLLSELLNCSPNLPGQARAEQGQPSLACCLVLLTLLQS